MKMTQRNTVQSKMMPILLLLLVGMASAWEVSYNWGTEPMHMFTTECIEFNATVTAEDVTSGIINVTLTSTHVATVDIPVIDAGDVSNNVWSSCLNVSANFLGTTNITMSITTNGIVKTANVLSVIVIREERVIDTVFTVSVATLVSLMYINFGCAINWEVCKKTIKRPIGPAIGFVSQFLWMPLLSYGIGRLIFPDSPELQLGMFFAGVSPGGGASNIWTVILGGNLNLSITMTTISTLAAFGMMPLWIFTLGARIFDRANLTIPYRNVTTFAVGLIIPLGIGYLLQKKAPRVSNVMVRILKPFSSMLILFIIIFAIVTNLYLFELFSWQIVVAGMGLPWLGYLFGMVVAIIFRQPGPDITAISVETGVQNTGISIFLLRFSLSQPTADLTTVVPVSVAMMTPIPLTLLWIGKSIYNRVSKNKKKIAASSEKLHDSQDPLPTISSKANENP